MVMVHKAICFHAVVAVWVNDEKGRDPLQGTILSCWFMICGSLNWSLRSLVHWHLMLQ